MIVRGSGATEGVDEVAADARHVELILRLEVDVVVAALAVFGVRIYVDLEAEVA